MRSSKQCHGATNKADKPTTTVQLIATTSLFVHTIYRMTPNEYSSFRCGPQNTTTTIKSFDIKMRPLKWQISNVQ